MKRFMFDSNIFDKIADGTLLIEMIEKSIEFDCEYYITHLQTDELARCPDEEKRGRLVLFLTAVRPNVIPSHSFIIGVSRLGFARLGDGKLYKRILNDNENNISDSIIGETAMKNNLTLVTEDVSLRNRINSLGGSAVGVQEFISIIATNARGLINE